MFETAREGHRMKAVVSLYLRKVLAVKKRCRRYGGKKNLRAAKKFVSGCPSNVKRWWRWPKRER